MRVLSYPYYKDPKIIMYPNFRKLPYRALRCDSWFRVAVSSLGFREGFRALGLGVLGFGVVAF